MSKPTISFLNQGEIDIRAIKIFGVCSKESENAIGYFGTGLKYALAILLRENQQVKIHIGLETYVFSTIKSKIRVDEFNIITMNGEELGFTTDLGKTWDLWQAYREVFCNMLDEGGTYETGTVEPRAGWTIVEVTGDKFRDIHDKRQAFILETEPILKLNNLHIHSGSTDQEFYRGLRVSPKALNFPTLFTYNVQEHVDLTEDRTLKYAFEHRSWVLIGIMQITDFSLLQQILCAPIGTYESGLDFREQIKLNETFCAVVKDTLDSLSKFINPTALKAFQNFTKTDRDYTPLELSEVEAKQLAKAISFCKTLGYAIEEFPIIVIATLGDRVLGRAIKNKIYISQAAFAKGTKCVTGTILEEFFHLSKGFQDESLAFQDYLIDQLITIGEKILGEPI